MKNLKTVIAILAISISSVFSVAANTNTEPTSPKKALHATIVKLLGHHHYDLKNQTLKAEISVLLNNKNELVVIDVATKDEDLESFVTQKLNYKKVIIKGITKGTIYRIPLKMIQSS
jgi:hypothetical protein